jgi:hypothetical protein
VANDVIRRAKDNFRAKSHPARDEGGRIADTLSFYREPELGATILDEILVRADKVIA